MISDAQRCALGAHAGEHFLFPLVVDQPHHLRADQSIAHTVAHRDDQRTVFHDQRTRIRKALFCEVGMCAYPACFDERSGPRSGFPVANLCYPICRSGAFLRRPAAISNLPCREPLLRSVVAPAVTAGMVVKGCDRDFSALANRLPDRLGGLRLV
jgi:hypothetical protein